MRTPEEFENHVYHLIAEKKQRRQKRLRLLAAVFVLLVFSAGFFWFQKPSPSFPAEEPVAGEAAPIPSMTLEEALDGHAESCRFEKDGSILTISDTKTLKALCSLLLQAVPSQAETAAPSFWGSLTLFYSNGESFSLFLTEDGFCDESGKSYRAASPESWHQELETLLKIPEN